MAPLMAPDRLASSSLYAMCAPYQLNSRHRIGSAKGRIGSAYGGRKMLSAVGTHAVVIDVCLGLSTP
jgi:hypothetical protein